MAGALGQHRAVDRVEMVFDKNKQPAGARSFYAAPGWLFALM